MATLRGEGLVNIRDYELTLIRGPHGVNIPASRGSQSFNFLTAAQWPDPPHPKSPGHCKTCKLNQVLHRNEETPLPQPDPQVSQPFLSSLRTTKTAKITSYWHPHKQFETGLGGALRCRLDPC